MTPQELKNSILQLAIQGKLVEQRPEEGTAEELYQQIQQEKQRLIKEGKIKKEKTLPEITEDEKPFDIPESWKWVRIGNAFTIFMGQSPDGGSVSESNVGIEFHQGKIYFTNRVIAHSPQKTTMPTKIAPANSLLICVRAPVGKVNITDRELCIGRGLSAIIPYCGMTEVFLFYWFQTYENVFIKQSTGTTFKAISADIINNQVIPLPPLAEQKRIVAKIEELLPLIERYEKAWNRLEEFNKRFPDDMQMSILQMAIQGKLVEQRPEEGTGEELYQQIQQEKQKLIKEGKIKKEKPMPEITEEEKPFDIPGSWKWVRWGELSESIQYGYNAPALDSGRIKMVRISDIHNNAVDWDTVPYCDIREEEIGSYLLAANDILFARTGGTVGKSYLVKVVPEEAVYAGYLIRTRYSTSLYPEYMKFFMESQLYWDQLHEGTIATAQPNCNGKTLSKMILPLPPLAEQKRIVARLKELLPLCEMLKYDA